MSADATEVISEIRKVDSATSNTQKQLRDVEKLLKFDPGNTELLAQKQRLLADAAEEDGEQAEDPGLELLRDAPLEEGDVEGEGL